MVFSFVCAPGRCVLLLICWCIVLSFIWFVGLRCFGVSDWFARFQLAGCFSVFGLVMPVLFGGIVVVFRFGVCCFGLRAGVFLLV